MSDHDLKALNDPPSREFTVRICDQCYRLEGEMCHNPECVFCRRTMAEVGEMLDALLIRPLVDGERLDLHPFGTEPTADHPLSFSDPQKARMRQMLMQAWEAGCNTPDWKHTITNEDYDAARDKDVDRLLAQEVP